MKVIILAGGGGNRLFPLSRTKFPKQFLNFNGGKSLLTQTIERFLVLVQPADMVIVTNQEYAYHVRAELVAAQAGQAHILLEPLARNTAPAIALALRYCVDRLGCGLDEVMLVTPSDHVISPVEAFASTAHLAEGMANQDRIVTFGVEPHCPETGYGYIQVGPPFGSGFAVNSFHEKPDKITAEGYLAAGNYYWNSGMFAFTINCMMNELRIHQPDIYDLADKSLNEILENFEEMPNISIDYAVIEKSKQVVLLPLCAKWSDIGSWDAIYDILDKDTDGNAFEGDCISLDCKNTLMMGQSRLIAGIGLEDLLVIETDDVILVAKKGESQKVKDLVNQIKADGRTIADEHTTVFRPWGQYSLLSGGRGYQMKKIAVNPGQILSLQMHYHRSEHWIVVGGTAKVTIGETEQMVHENESVFIPQTTKHRLENPGKLLLEIIELQNGGYLEEDDIVRFEDIYGREDADRAVEISVGV
ncbi:MAG: mannose-1-phosphate guanylyltransferase/mannose-6-phosphate isomerase [Dehalobacter sp. 4CP]|uniref:mannose-1-phosphate guanylyltransferase/mannose-6-phosphate isomerase n=1 Tax=Dehalobacter sp. CP TaxID=2594474 RepID=UPI0013C78299|nr:mannose-1-phosphate guanylyltransferase/mannose-6-phosphate isomerase [Dehalobacter sp.]NBJ14498.1 mannose-1-phosphate guanylyltransferase/mannose-6-phosphate isomerase [Dehalobacter sp. 4CP]